MDFVRIKGITKAYNVTGFFYLCRYSVSKESNESVIPAKKGDFLGLTLDDDDGIYLEHDGKTGSAISVERENGKVYINKKLHTISPSSDLQRIVSELSDTEARSLNYLYMKDNFDPVNFNRLSAINRNVNFICESASVADELFRLFEPRWLILNKGLDARISIPRSIKTLVLNNGSQDNLGLLSGSDLESLHLNGSSIDRFPQDDLRLPNLKELKIAQKGVRIGNLSERFPALRSLTLLDTGEIESFESLGSLSELRSLNLAGTRIKDTAGLLKLRNLSYFSPPDLLTGEDFNSIVRNNPGLEFIDFTGDQGIKNFGALKNLKHLKGIGLNLSEIPYESLEELTNLRIMFLPQAELEENPEKIEELGKALPDCEVVPTLGACLGSAWIAALFLCAFLILFMPKIIEKKIKR